MTDIVATIAPVLTTILLAVDDVDASIGAITVATQLAATNRCELIVLSVLPVTEGYGLLGLDARAAEEDRTVSMVQRIADEAMAKRVNARALTTRGKNAADVIVQAAKELKADVLVMGRRGRRDLARAMLGDLTARVIGAAPCPVLVVPRAAAFPKSRILHATDGSPAAERAGRTALLCSRMLGLPVTVLSVATSDQTAEKQADATKFVERTVAFMRARGVEATPLVTRGIAADEIVRVAQDTAADLLVVGSEGRSGLNRVMLGANSQAVIGKATYPVLVATAQMPEYSAPRTRPPHANEVRKALEGEARRTFLIVADDTEEMDHAIDFACRRAQATGGVVMVLQVLPGQAPAGTGAQAAAEVPARGGVDRIAEQIERAIGERPKTFIRWGDTTREVLALLAAEPAISALVLAASADPRGPGPLITGLVTKHAAELPVPLMIVPGHAGRRPT